MKKVFLLLIFCTSALAKVLIITHSYNRPDFIEIQQKTFKKFLKDEYIFVVFNDARDLKNWQFINTTCKKLKLRCVSIPQKIHDMPYLNRYPGENYQNPCCRCANVVQFSLDNLGFNWQDYVMIIDSDMFLIKPFSVKEFMQDSLIAGVPQTRGGIDYLWNGLLLFDMFKLPNKRKINFNCGKVNGESCDVGGYTYYYFNDNETIIPKYINHVHINGRKEDQLIPKNSLQGRYQKMADSTCAEYKKDSDDFLHELEGFNENLIAFAKTGIQDVEFLCDGNFFHYRSGGNWNEKSSEFHKKKSQIFKEFIKQITCENNT